MYDSAEAVYKPGLSLVADLERLGQGLDSGLEALGYAHVLLELALARLIRRVHELDPPTLGPAPWDSALQSGHGRARPSTRKWYAPATTRPVDAAPRLRGSRQPQCGCWGRPRGTGTVPQQAAGAADCTEAAVEDLTVAIALGLLGGIALAIFARIRAWRRIRRAEATCDVAELTKIGWRIEAETERDVVIVRSHRVNHLLHFIVGLFTLGLWWIVWIIIAIFGGEKRRSFAKPVVQITQAPVVEAELRGQLRSDPPAIQDRSDRVE